MECARKFKKTTSKLCDFAHDANYVAAIEELDKHIAEAMKLIPSTPRNATERVLRAAINETCVARMAIIPTDMSVDIRHIWIKIHKIWMRAEIELRDILETEMFWKSVRDVTSDLISSVTNTTDKTIISEIDDVIAAIDAEEIASLVAEIDTAEIMMLIDDINVATNAWKRVCREIAT